MNLIAPSVLSLLLVGLAADLSSTTVAITPPSSNPTEDNLTQVTNLIEEAIHPQYLPVRGRGERVKGKVSSLRPAEQVHVEGRRRTKVPAPQGREGEGSAKVSREEAKKGQEAFPIHPTPPSSSQAQAAPSKIHPASPQTTSSPSLRPAQQGDRKVVAYFTDWTAGKYGPDAIPYDKITHVNYAFSLFDDQTWAPTVTTGSILDQVVLHSHAKGVKVAVSIGGWTGSRYFSPMVASADHRATFIKATKDMIEKYKLDGIDLDWEYPGRVGMACNVVDKEKDTVNFLTFLKELRQALGPEKFISLAVRVQPFDGPSGPINNVQEYSKYLDFINVMAYDINGSWSSKTAPNAPLVASSQGGDPFSVVQSLKSWTSAGFPKEKLVMGVPFYGRSLITTSPSSNESMYMDFVKSVPQGDADDAPWAEPCPGAAPALSGQWKWKNLREQGILTSPTQAAQGWKRNWDNQTQTPWLYNPSTKQFISYDDPQSLLAKVAAIKENGLAGAMVWALNQDNGELLDAVSRVRE